MTSHFKRRFFFSVAFILAAFPSWAESAIAIATDAKTGVKYFSVDGKPFTPIGVNYLVPHTGGPYQSFGMFDKGVFDAQKTDRDFAAIADNGFNFVRLWLKGMDPDRGFDSAPGKIDPGYIDNVVATLQAAERRHLRVVLTGAFRDGLWLPKNYLPLGALPDESQIGGSNRLLLIPEMAEAAGHFYYDLIMEIKKKDQGSLNSLFYFDLYNELQFDISKPPFSQASGAFVFKSETYDLAELKARQSLMDRAAQSWFSAVSRPVKSAYPGVFVTASSFYVAAFGHSGFDGGKGGTAGRGPSPYPLRSAAIVQGGADLIDIHTYPSQAKPGTPSFHDRIAGLLAANELNVKTAFDTPVIIGEFGAEKEKFAQIADAVAELTATSAVMCNFHVAGFAVWMWKGPGDTWTLEDEPLMKGLAPKFHPQFCSHRV